MADIDGMETFPSARSLVRARAPQSPVTCLRPAAAARAAGTFLGRFPGAVLYAVKTNPRPEILDAVHGAGIRRFDVASIAEIALIGERYPGARMSFMHPVKNRDAIRQAYFQWGVRDFALDSADELEKILDATHGARDLCLLVRLAVPNHLALMDLSAKFGIGGGRAARLLLATRRRAARLGICFHVGSQCMDPGAFATALYRVREVILASAVMVDIVDVGGGFPSAYADMTPPPLAAYMDEIRAALKTLPVGDACETWAEPGRALAAEASSTVVHVDHAKGDRLYINDGTYGSLFDAGVPGFVFPVRAIGHRRRDTEPLVPYSFYGPTCDGIDHMKGPFFLPAGMGEGDYIEIGMTGAYGCTMRTRFNGFHSDHAVLLCDAPMLSMYARGEDAAVAPLRGTAP